MILLLVFSLIFPQKVYTFTEEEVKSLFSSIKELERQDSLNNELIINLENQLKNSEVITKNDSLIIIELETQLKLKDDLIKDMIFDSLEAVKFLHYLENKFDFKIKNYMSKNKNFQTIYSIME